MDDFPKGTLIIFLVGVYWKLVTYSGNQSSASVILSGYHEGEKLGQLGTNVGVTDELRTPVHGNIGY